MRLRVQLPAPRGVIIQPVPTDLATTIATFINSPPAQVATGGVLACFVWKFFERVEAILSDQTKFEIAVQLVSVETVRRIQPWVETFISMFDRVFGPKHLSLSCFWRSCVAPPAAVRSVQEKNEPDARQQSRENRHLPL